MTDEDDEERRQFLRSISRLDELDGQPAARPLGLLDFDRLGRRDSYGVLGSLGVLDSLGRLDSHGILDSHGVRDSLGVLDPHRVLGSLGTVGSLGIVRGAAGGLSSVATVRERVGWPALQYRRDDGSVDAEAEGEQQGDVPARRISRRHRVNASTEGDTATAGDVSSGSGASTAGDVPTAADASETTTSESRRAQSGETPASESARDSRDSGSDSPSASSPDPRTSSSRRVSSEPPERTTQSAAAARSEEQSESAVRSAERPRARSIGFSGRTGWGGRLASAAADADDPHTALDPVARQESRRVGTPRTLRRQQSRSATEPAAVPPTARTHRRDEQGSSREERDSPPDEQGSRLGGGFLTHDGVTAPQRRERSPQDTASQRQGGHEEASPGSRASRIEREESRNVEESRSVERSRSVEESRNVDESRNVEESRSVEKSGPVGERDDGGERASETASRSSAGEDASDADGDGSNRDSDANERAGEGPSSPEDPAATRTRTETTPAGENEGATTDETAVATTDGTRRSSDSVARSSASHGESVASREEPVVLREQSAWRSIHRPAASRWLETAGPKLRRVGTAPSATTDHQLEATGGPVAARWRPSRPLVSRRHDPGGVDAGASPGSEASTGVLAHRHQSASGEGTRHEPRDAHESQGTDLPRAQSSLRKSAAPQGPTASAELPASEESLASEELPADTARREPVRRETSNTGGSDPVRAPGERHGAVRGETHGAVRAEAPPSLGDWTPSTTVAVWSHSGGWNGDERGRAGGSRSGRSRSGRSRSGRGRAEESRAEGSRSGRRREHGQRETAVRPASRQSPTAAGPLLRHGVAVRSAGGDDRRDADEERGRLTANERGSRGSSRSAVAGSLSNAVAASHPTATRLAWLPQTTRAREAVAAGSASTAEQVSAVETATAQPRQSGTGKQPRRQPTHPGAQTTHRHSAAQPADDTADGDEETTASGRTGRERTRQRDVSSPVRHPAIPTTTARRYDALARSHTAGGTGMSGLPAGISATEGIPSTRTPPSEPRGPAVAHERPGPPTQTAHRETVRGETVRRGKVAGESGETAAGRITADGTEAGEPRGTVTVARAVTTDSGGTAFRPETRTNATGHTTARSRLGQTTSRLGQTVPRLRTIQSTSRPDSAHSVSQARPVQRRHRQTGTADAATEAVDVAGPATSAAVEPASQTSETAPPEATRAAELADAAAGAAAESSAGAAAEASPGASPPAKSSAVEATEPPDASATRSASESRQRSAAGQRSSIGRLAASPPLGTRTRPALAAVPPTVRRVTSHTGEASAVTAQPTETAPSAGAGAVRAPRVSPTILRRTTQPSVESRQPPVASESDPASGTAARRGERTAARSGSSMTTRPASSETTPRTPATTAALTQETTAARTWPAKTVRTVQSPGDERVRPNATATTGSPTARGVGTLRTTVGTTAVGREAVAVAEAAGAEAAGAEPAVAETAGDGVVTGAETPVVEETAANEGTVTVGKFSAVDADARETAASGTTASRTTASGTAASGTETRKTATRESETTEVSGGSTLTATRPLVTHRKPSLQTQRPHSTQIQRPLSRQTQREPPHRTGRATERAGGLVSSPLVTVSDQAAGGRRNRTVGTAPTRTLRAARTDRQTRTDEMARTTPDTTRATPTTTRTTPAAMRTTPATQARSAEAEAEAKAETGAEAERAMPAASERESQETPPEPRMRHSRGPERQSGRGPAERQGRGDGRSRVSEGAVTHPAARRERHGGVTDEQSGVHPSERRRRARMGDEQSTGASSGAHPSSGRGSQRGHGPQHGRGTQQGPGSQQGGAAGRASGAGQRQANGHGTHGSEWEGRHPAANRSGSPEYDIDTVLESDAMVDQVVGRLYREFERKMRIERRRRGL